MTDPPRFKHFNHTRYFRKPHMLPAHFRKIFFSCLNHRSTSEFGHQHSFCWRCSRLRYFFVHRWSSTSSECLCRPCSALSISPSNPIPFIIELVVTPPQPRVHSEFPQVLALALTGLPNCHLDLFTLSLFLFLRPRPLRVHSHSYRKCYAPRFALFGHHSRPSFWHFDRTVLQLGLAMRAKYRICLCSHRLLHVPSS